MMSKDRGGVRLLPPGTGSLAWARPPVPAGTLLALSDHGGISVTPPARLTVIFGRDEPEVHVCVGAGDRGVSRRHGLIRRDGGSWTVENTGHLPIHLPGSQLLLTGHYQELPIGYTPLFIGAGRHRQHLLEVRVAEPAPVGSATTWCEDQRTVMPAVYELSEREHLVLVALAQRYLRHEPYPQPLAWTSVAKELKRRQPEVDWTAKSAEHVIASLRAKLVKRGHAGLTRDGVGEPVGNLLNHNLITEMLISAAIVPSDLELLARESNR